MDSERRTFDFDELPEIEPGEHRLSVASQRLNASKRTAVRACVEVPLTWRTTRAAKARILSFDGLMDEKEHIAIEVARRAHDRPPLVRVHSECLTGDVFGSGRCDCGEQLAEALHIMNDEGGVILYLRQEGRGIGLYNKLDAYVLQDRGYDTFEANRELRFPDDLRDYRVAAQMLRVMGINAVRLLSNNPVKKEDLERGGITVTEQCRTGVHVNSSNRRYLAAKVKHASHTIELD